MTYLLSKQYEAGMVIMTIDESGASTAAVTFNETWLLVPQVFVVDDAGDAAGGATRTASSVTTTGFSITIADSSFTSGTKVRVRWLAWEKE